MFRYGYYFCVVFCFLFNFLLQKVIFRRLFLFLVILDICLYSGVELDSNLYAVYMYFVCAIKSRIASIVSFYGWHLLQCRGQLKFYLNLFSGYQEMDFPHFKIWTNMCKYLHAVSSSYLQVTKVGCSVTFKIWNKLSY